MAAPGDSSLKLANTLRLTGTKQTVPTSTTTAQSSAFQTGTKVIRVWSDVECFLDGGSNPIATTSEVPLSARSVEYFHVNGGDKIAVILASGTGTLHILEG